MLNHGLCAHHTAQQSKEQLLSLQLFGRTKWSEEKQIASLYALSNTIEDHYQPATIVKRNGALRQLFVPDPILKKVQKNILHNIFDALPISDYATAYKQGGSIVTNAASHVGKQKLLTLDIENFFATISFPMVYKSAFPHHTFPPAIRTLLTNLCCYKDSLPQGAPTSAAISNLVMVSFDEYIGQWCTQQKISYTRYCDDMAFSGNFDARQVKNKVQNFLLSMGFKLNDQKTKLLSRHQRQAVTGITVNDKAQVSSQYRKELRQILYYCQKYGVASHLATLNDHIYLPQGNEGMQKYLSILLGKINFVLQVNPDDAGFQNAKLFVNKLIKDTL